MIKECNCLKSTEQRIINHVAVNKKDVSGFKVLSGHWEHKSWFPKIRLYVNFIVKSTFTKKNGTTSTVKNNRVSVFFTYCPFCGQKYENE